MAWSIDARIPVTLAAPEMIAPASDTAFLLQTGLAAPAGSWAEHFDPTAHGIGCAEPGCVGCAPRPPAAVALDRLFLARARGVAPFFRHVMMVASTERHAELAAMLRDDTVVRARYRAEPT